jgi:UDP-N-acetylglucosamine--N-acetylmuramyl-(pentapeptide) pyrophosphoryl-undecaprenol N-acetylglucosamine transferase
MNRYLLQLSLIRIKLFDLERRIIISGGGTGGHIFPAIAVAQELKRMDNDIRIKFVGASGRMEMDRVPKAGFEIVGLPISGLQRKLSVKNLQVPFKLLASLIKAFNTLKSFKPQVVVGFGGYASGPVCMVASMMKIPIVLQEQNSYAGLTNKMLAKKAVKICVAYDGMDKFFENEKIIFTGNPVRQDISELKDKKEESHENFGLARNKKTILIFGGSLGAGTLNKAVKHNIKRLSELFDIQIIWQVGKYYYEDYKDTMEAKMDNVRLFPFIERMDLAYAAADLVVCRAGALTISELCLAAKPAILVPSPIVAEDHQTKNAMSLVTKDAAWLLKDHEVIEKLADTIALILNDGEKLNLVSQEIAKLGRKQASVDIAKTVLNAIKPAT